MFNREPADGRDNIVQILVDISYILVDTGRMLDKIFGNKTVEKILLNLYHYGELHASLLARISGLPETPIKNQLYKLEDAGLLISKEAGRARVFSLNPKSPFTKPIKEMIGIVYENIPLKERETLFSYRNRPRRRGKPLPKKS